MSAFVAVLQQLMHVLLVYGLAQMCILCHVMCGPRLCRVRGNPKADDSLRGLLCDRGLTDLDALPIMMFRTCEFLTTAAKACSAPNMKKYVKRGIVQVCSGAPLPDMRGHTEHSPMRHALTRAEVHPSRAA